MYFVLFLFDNMPKIWQEKKGINIPRRSVKGLFFRIMMSEKSWFKESFAFITLVIKLLLILMSYF